MTATQQDIYDSPIPAGMDIESEFWTEMMRIYEIESQFIGTTIPLVELRQGYLSTRGYSRTLGDYSRWQGKVRIFGLIERTRRSVWFTALHELAHHLNAVEINNTTFGTARHAELTRGGRGHGLGFKQQLARLEHRYAQVGHSSDGSAGCRGSSRKSQADRLQSNSVCKESDMAKAAAKKNTATTATPDIFKVTVNIEEPFKRPSGGIIITPHEFTVYAEAKTDLAAQGKVLRAYGLSDRDNAKFTVKVEHVKAPAKIKRAPVYVIQKAS